LRKISGELRIVFGERRPEQAVEVHFVLVHGLIEAGLNAVVCGERRFRGAIHRIDIVKLFGFSGAQRHIRHNHPAGFDPAWFGRYSLN